MTPEQQADLEKRKQEFLPRYKALIDELHLDLFSYPLYVPDGTGCFKTVIQTDIIDTTNQPTKSPFIAS